MGNAGVGSTLASNISLGQNIARLSQTYPLDASGRLGTKDVGSQVIFTDTPMATAEHFLDRLTAGGKLKDSSTESIKHFRFPGSKETVIFRPISAHGSPAISINAKSHFGHEYKIHFVKPGENLGAKK